SSASSFESATIQLRISPGGSTRFSLRRRPELPPSSVTVTIAVSSVMGRREFGCSSLRRTTYSFNPRSSVDSPVPPPSATTRNPRESVFGLFFFFFTGRGSETHRRNVSFEVCSATPILLNGVLLIAKNRHK